MMKRFIILCSFFVCTASMAQDAAEEKKARWYQVNITLFQQAPDSRLDESFSFEPLALNMADVITLKSSQPLALARSGMNAALTFHHENVNNGALVKQTIDDDWAEKIANLDPVKQPILYNGQWQQPVYDEKHSLPIYIESSIERMGTPQLKGLFYLHVSRYLHSKIDLQFMPNDASSANDLISFQQSRRMRSKEIHYIDHPLVGAVIRILPVEHPLKPTEEAEKKPAETASR